MIEELFKCSQKEFPTLLDDNIYKTKYAVAREIDNITLKDIAHNITIVRGNVFFNRGTSKNIVNALAEFKYYYRPLTIKDVQELKLNTIIESVNSWSGAKFKHFVCKKFLDYYPEDNIDIVDDNITIYFPEIIIRNSIEMSHLLKDVYVKIAVRDSYMYLYDMKRTTYTVAELNNNYMFSHLSHCGYTYSADDNSNFCFGRENPISTIMAAVNSSRVGILRNLSAFFPILEEYLQWESIEGTPFYYIEKVLNDKNALNTAQTPEYNINELLGTLKENIIKFNYTFNIDCNNRYNIKLKQGSIDTIDAILTEKYPHLAYLNLEGESVVPKEVRPNKKNLQGAKALTFKGEDKYINILESTIENNTLPTKLHSEVLKNIINVLTKRFEDYLINKKYGNI